MFANPIQIVILQAYLKDFFILLRFLAPNEFETTITRAAHIELIGIKAI